jgi:CRISPR system Cascade subunit CasA
VLNLLNDPWPPVLRRDFRRCLIGLSRPAECRQRLASSGFPRGDAEVADRFARDGLSAKRWELAARGWREPPEPNRLDEALAPFAHAFFLDGDSSRFLQDMEELVSNSEPIERLLIETPGDSSIGRNTDLLVHRDGASGLCRAAAAMALYTFQAWAPAGAPATASDCVAAARS